MELSRRDAIAALAASGIAIGAGVGVSVVDDRRPDDSTPSADQRTSSSTSFDDAEYQTMVAIARIVYPSDLSGIDSFTRTYLDGKTANDPTFLDEASAVIDRLNELSIDWYDDRFIDLETSTQEHLLREVGVDTAEADSTGSPAARIRHYLINELLFALYTSPTGGALVGIENPQGHPGGLASYQRGPEDDA